MLGQGWSFHIRAMNLLSLRAGVKLTANKCGPVSRGKRSAEFQLEFQLCAAQIVHFRAELELCAPTIWPTGLGS